MGDLIVGAIILALVGGAVYKLRWNKKHGVRCTGCSSCPTECHCDDEKK